MIRIYSFVGRDCELIPLLRGVVTNPNCEFHGNTIAIHTLAQWSRCNSQMNAESVSDIKLETENDDYDENHPNYLTENIYHPRVALHRAIKDWLNDFFEERKTYGKMLKPQPASAVTLAPIPPLQKVNTCMTVTLTTSSSTITTQSVVPVPLETSQLLALADICSTVTPTNESLPKSSLMNSLMSTTKVITTDAISAPILSSSIRISESGLELPEKTAAHSPIDVMDVEKLSSEAETFEAMDCGTPKHTLSDSSSLNSEPPAVKDEHETNANSNGDKTEKSQLSDDVVMAESITDPETMQDESISEDEKFESINYDDILLLCDLFYLPFEHG